MQNKGILFLIPNVIADDSAELVIPAYNKKILTEINLFLAENIKSARRFISTLSLGIDISSLQFEELNKHTSENDLLEAMQPLFLGQDMGIISEAGCPGVADPGSLAVKIAHENKNRVVPLTGPSAFLLALMASGLNGQSFAFHGYLPIDKKQRQNALRSLEKNIKISHQTQIFMDTPYRNQQLLEDILRVCAPGTLLCIAAGLTGKHEFIRTQTIQEWRKEKVHIHKIPAVFLMGTI